MLYERTAKKDELVRARSEERWKRKDEDSHFPRSHRSLRASASRKTFKQVHKTI